MFPRAGAHQLGQEAFKSILAEDADWKPFPAFPPSVRLAVVVGQPSEPGPYTIRIILPGNTPHFHWAKSGEYVTQITAMGPLGLEYLSATDDPRNNNS